MTRNKFLKIFIISFVALILSFSLVYSFYTFYKDINGSKLEISTVQFSLNGENVKNNDVSIPVSTNTLTEKDGLVLSFGYAVTGTFTFNYAVEYSLYFHFLDDLTIEENKLVNATEVYEYINGKYLYKCMLSELIYTDNNQVYCDNGF